MDAATEEGADRQHDRGRFEGDAGDRDDAPHPVAFDHEVRDFLLEERQVRVVLEQMPDGALVELAVRLGAGARARPGLCCALSVRNWMPARSVARAMAPPSASISWTRWPLPMPPTAGLQLIWPRVSMLWVSSSVCAPMRAGGKGRLGAGVTAADDDDIEWAREAHGVRVRVGGRAAYCRGGVGSAKPH